MRNWKLETRNWVALSMILLPGLVSGAETNAPLRLGAEQVVREALVHSRTLQLAGEEVRAAVAREEQAGAAAWPSLKAEARAGHYEGLKESSSDAPTNAS